MMEFLTGWSWKGAALGLGMGALGMMGAAVAPASAEVAPLDPLQDVKVAYVPIMKFATAFVAEARDIFEKYGLNVEFERVRSGTEAIAFLDQGSVDVGGIAIVASLWSAWDRGLDIRIIAPGALDPMENGPTVLIARADLEGVDSIADLKGKRVAVAGGPGSGGEYFVAKALETAGLTIRDVELMNVGNADMPASMEAKSDEALRTGTRVIYDPNVEIPVDALAEVERVHRENGRTEYEEPLDLSKVVDETFVTKAIETLGRRD